MTHTYRHLYPRFIVCTDAYFFFMFTGAFPLHACSITYNLRTYFTSVRRVFLVETVVLQTALWDIRAWSARFLVKYSCMNILYTKCVKKMQTLNQQNEIDSRPFRIHTVSLLGNTFIRLAKVVCTIWGLLTQYLNAAPPILNHIFWL